MHSVTAKDINNLIIRAQKSEKMRSHLPLHKHSDPVLKLIMAMEPSTYIQPNRHVGENLQELFIGLKGEFLVLQYDDKGIITDYVVIGPDQETLMVEIPAGVWHTMWPLVSGSVAIEVIKGPYDEKTYKEFAPWAPSEDNPFSGEYKEKILKGLKIPFYPNENI